VPGFVRRNIIFFTLPFVMLAIAFFARASFQAAQSFGVLGEQSIVNSTFVLAREKVAHIENRIFSIDHTYFQAINPDLPEASCERWQSALPTIGMVAGAAIIDDEGEIEAFFHRGEDGEVDRSLLRLLTNEIIPTLNPWDSFYQHKHYHMRISGEYWLVSTYTIDTRDRLYTTCLIYDTREIISSLLATQLFNVGARYTINVKDYDSRLIWGQQFSSEAGFIVVQQFPSTLYRWRLQLAPDTASFFVTRTARALASDWILIPMSSVVIVLSLVILYIVWVRERRLNRLKSDFIANASHELKTPLALIRMFSELLSMEQVNDPDKIKHYFQVIQRESDRLTALIDNLLDFSRLEQGQSAYAFREIQLADVVAQAVEIYQHRVEEIAAALVFRKEDEMPLVQADADAVTLALLNLIDNAVKHARGTDVVGVEVYRRGRFVHLDVYDHGAGIPAQHIRRIFERFYRFSNTTTEGRKQRGSGIGLSLVKHIARAHGGHVTVSSSPGTETRFSIRFPV
jgi:two-component system phosphate regulon sensor histidine kinase PhoR